MVQLGSSRAAGSAPLAPGVPRAPTSAAAKCARAAPAGARAVGGLLCGELRDPLGLVHGQLSGLRGPRPLGVDRCVGAAAAASPEERAEARGMSVCPRVVPAVGRLRLRGPVAIPRVADVGLPVALLLCAGRGSGLENSAGGGGAARGREALRAVQPAARPCEPRPPRRCVWGREVPPETRAPRVHRHRPGPETRGPVSAVTARNPGRKLSTGLVLSAPGRSRLSLGARTQAHRARSCAGPAGWAGTAPTFRLLEPLQLLACLLQAQVQLVAGTEQAQQVAGAPGAARVVHESPGRGLPMRPELEPLALSREESRL